MYDRPPLPGSLFSVFFWTLCVILETASIIALLFLTAYFYVVFRQLLRDFEASTNSLLVCPVASGRFVPDAGHPTLKLPPTVQYCAEIDVRSPERGLY